MPDEISIQAIERLRRLQPTVCKYPPKYQSTFQQMMSITSHKFFVNANRAALAYQRIAVNTQCNLAPLQSMNLAKLAHQIVPLYPFQRQMAAIVGAIPVQEIVYANQKIREGIMNSLEGISCDAAEKEQLKNIFQNEELLSCADDIVEEMANTSNEEMPLDNSSAAETQPERFSLLKHGIDLETAVVFTYVLAFAVFVIYCIRTDSLTEDDFFAFWLYIFQLLVGGMDAIEGFAAEYPYLAGLTAQAIMAFIVSKLSNTKDRDQEKAVE